jgi:hypothetical protein
MIAKIWAILQAETIYIPLHHQTLAYAMKDGWNIATSPQDRIDMRAWSEKAPTGWGLAAGAAASTACRGSRAGADEAAFAELESRLQGQRLGGRPR